MGRANGFSALQHRSTRLPKDPGEKNSCKSVFKKSSTKTNKQTSEIQSQMHFLKKTMIFHSKISFAEQSITFNNFVLHLPLHLPISLKQLNPYRGT